MNSWRKDFPILSREVQGRPLAYLDNGATTQKPQSVLDAMNRFYTYSNANVHRGAHTLSQEATELYEGARARIARYLGGVPAREVIFTKGTTEAMNLVAASWGRKFLQAGDTVVVTRMEHHAVFVTWQAIAAERGARLRVVGLTKDGQLDLADLDQALAERPKVLAFTAMSNVLGTLNPVREIAEKASAAGALVIVDAAQAAAHGPIRPSEMGPVDFVAFSSHKMFGPTGLGVLWGREKILDSMPPYQFGGDMILRVSEQKTLWNELPWKFEAGTPAIAEAIGFAAALDYIERVGWDMISRHESELLGLAMRRLQEVPSLRILGPQDLSARGSVVAFTLGRVHPHDLATFLDAHGVAVRAGHHCAQPLHDHLGIPASTRASFALYNTTEEIETLARALVQAQEFFS